MKSVFYGFCLAIQFLTRIPIPLQCPWNSKTSKWALRSYPFVGLIIGIIMMITYMALESHLPAHFLTLLIISGWVWVTGGLHLDGWMDVADAVGSNAPLEKKWVIMKDPHVGSFGHIALLFLLAWKTVLVYELLHFDMFIMAFLFIVTYSRLGVVMLMIFLPTAKREGLAWEWKKNLSRNDLIFAIIPVVVLSLLFPVFFFYVPAYILFVILYGRWVIRTFKGTNGDLLGAAIEGGELWGLVVTWIYFSFVMA
ncbi:adenosylcobinamide-GDP ribazoletransferase [Metabacillus halosaccharovorans]|uniref:adenosylcobinamide-GDP ribazoletransferase n=1 Tax=Metabacillus halosaccharovorans TaxID=930124 RepID=UPI0020422DBE|nr:adenosylcobinamide-GDP ribazoletransferase [Metabacillus halosaccharovorans]MCM3439482.1 adenosylcobinamide-GDP ribazoletransferase [Metabacillus halosaccharovorans]